MLTRLRPILFAANAIGAVAAFLATTGAPWKW